MRGSRKCATTDLRSLPVGIMAFASASVQYVLIFVNESVIQLRVFSAGRPEGSVLVRFVFAYGVERNMSLDHQPMFQPVSSRVRIIERVLFNMVAFRPLSRSQLRAEISGNDCGVFGCSCSAIQCMGTSVRRVCPRIPYSLMLQYRGNHSP